MVLAVLRVAQIEKAVTWGGTFHVIFYKFIQNVLKPLFHNKKNNKKNARIYV